MPSRAGLICFALVLLSLQPACRSRPADARVTGDGIALEPVVSGLSNPVHLSAPPGDARLFVVEQPGRIRIVRDGRLLKRPFLDLTARVRFGGERGLLSVAFHPQYASNGLFFVNFTDRGGATRVERFRVSDNPDVADPGSSHLVITIEQPFGNHNGGHVLFGPDGLLYVGMGDGGSAGDPHGNGQSRASLLGKLLRLDVDAREPYAIPAGNPFARGGGRPEIWALGLRNPWRMWIDPVDRRLYVADVGQDRWEEIDVAPLDAAGLNYGWNIREGRHCYRSAACDTSGLFEPVVEYGHDAGCSITGGIVYRGAAIAALDGFYLYADYCSGWIRAFRDSAGTATGARALLETRVGSVSSFGADAAGEAYVLTLEGGVFKMVAAAGDAPERR